MPAPTIFVIHEFVAGVTTTPILHLLESLTGHPVSGINAQLQTLYHEDTTRRFPFKKVLLSPKLRAAVE